MSSQAIGQRFRVSRGCCWQCVQDCRCRLAEARTFSQMAYNKEIPALLRACLAINPDPVEAVGDMGIIDNCLSVLKMKAILNRKAPPVKAQIDAIIHNAVFGVDVTLSKGEYKKVKK